MTSRKSESAFSLQNICEKVFFSEEMQHMVCWCVYLNVGLHSLVQKSCWDYVDRLQTQYKYLNISYSYCLYIKAKRIKDIKSFWSSSLVQQGVKHYKLANDAFCLQIKLFCSRSAANKRVSLKGVHQGTKLTFTPPAIVIYIYIYIYIHI